MSGLIAILLWMTPASDACLMGPKEKQKQRPCSMAAACAACISLFPLRLDPKSIGAFFTRLPNIQELPLPFPFHDLLGDECGGIVAHLLDTAPWLPSPQFEQARVAVRGAYTLSEQMVARLQATRPQDVVCDLCL